MSVAVKIRKVLYMYMRKKATSFYTFVSSYFVIDMVTIGIKLSYTLSMAYVITCYYTLYILLHHACFIFSFCGM